jgi:hypothetical protein
MLMQAASKTLLTLAHDDRRLGATPAITMVLHTWTRELVFHPHVHAIVSAGGLRAGGAQPQWVHGSKRYLFPVKVMAKLFRHLFRTELLRAIDDGTVRVPGDCDGPMRAALFSKRWVVYAKQPFGGAEQVFSYLGRYTHRVGISNARILRSEAGTVAFATKNGRTCTLTHVEFLRRLLLHVLPKGFHKIRHCGLASASHVRLGLLDRACLLLAPECIRENVPDAAISGAPQSWVDCLFLLTGVEAMRCPRCETGAMTRQPLPVTRPRLLNDTS